MGRKSVDEIDKEISPFETIHLAIGIINDRENTVQLSTVSEEIPFGKALQLAFPNCEPLSLKFLDLNDCLHHHCPHFFETKKPRTDNESIQLEDLENFAEIIFDAVSYVDDFALLRTTISPIERIKKVIENGLSQYAIEIIPFDKDEHIFRCKTKGTIADDLALQANPEVSNALRYYQASRSDAEKRGNLDVLIGKVEADNKLTKDNDSCNKIHQYIQCYRHYEDRKKNPSDQWFYSASLSQREDELFALCTAFLAQQIAQPIIEKYDAEQKGKK